MKMTPVLTLTLFHHLEKHTTNLDQNLMAWKMNRPGKNCSINTSTTRPGGGVTLRNLHVVFVAMSVVRLVVALKVRERVNVNVTLDT